MNQSVLVGGPHDGQKIKSPGDGLLPSVVYVNPKSVGDRYAAWSRERRERFPHEYRRGIIGYLSEHILRKDS